MSFIVKIKKQLALYELLVDLETEAGILAVIGGSGSGKSMTLKCIAGIETPDSGFISLNGRVLYDSSKKINLPPQKRNVGYLFQEYALFPTMTAAENISIVMKQKNPVQVQKWLEEYGLGDYADSYPDHLSGGQKQRLAMIRMLAAEPQCILLDEPFSALDEHIKRKMEREVMEMLHDFDKPILFVSHNQEEVYRLADRIGSMENGRFSPIRAKRAVFGEPAGGFAVQRAVVAGDVLGVPEGVAGMDFGIEDFDIPAPLTEVVAVQLDVLQTDVRRVCEEVVALIERALFNENVSTGPKRFLGVRERTVADFNAVRIAEGLRALEPGVRHLEVLQVPETGAGGYLEKAVVDHGIGIDPEGILALNVAVGQREIRAVLDGRITGENRNVIEFGVRKLVKGAFAAESLISDELHDVPIFLLFFVVL